LDFWRRWQLAILLADNYSRTITNITTRGAEHAEDERTEKPIAQKKNAEVSEVHRDVLVDFKVVSSFAIFVSGGLDVPGSPSTVPHPRFGLALGGPVPVGKSCRQLRHVRACPYGLATKGLKGGHGPSIWQSAKFNKFSINAHIFDNSNHMCLRSPEYNRQYDKR